ncbi:MAG: 1-acyl-sn-glycerol-3-phosphate acyltransferase [Pelomonas sp.]|nr:1-acyl-sn-glycerol-3-phosphate acyltransferase [Roseateles sp.]
MSDIAAAAASAIPPAAAPSLIAGPRPVPLRGSRVARALLGLFGWRVAGAGLPALQGVVMVYPHTSNWDFVVAILAKWAFGIPVRFWAKDSLFRAPLFGAWVRWIGGVAVDRGSRNGIVADTAQALEDARARGEFFWLAVAPEGTRKRTEGWRSGAYQVARQARVPVGLATLDFGRKCVDFTRFVAISGDADADFALFARELADCRGKRPADASPVRLRA